MFFEDNLEFFSQFLIIGILKNSLKKQFLVYAKKGGSGSKITFFLLSPMGYLSHSMCGT